MKPEEIRILRGEMTRNAFAHLFGVTKETIWYWEHDGHQPRGPALKLLRMMKDDRTRIIRVLKKISHLPWEDTHEIFQRSRPGRRKATAP